MSTERNDSTHDGSNSGQRPVEVIVGEIPAADDPTVMVWTARCSDGRHDLLGQFGTRPEAEATRDEHLRTAHGAGS